MQAKKFLYYYFVLFFLFIGIGFLFNYTIDPYGLNNHFQLKGFNTIKTQTETKNRKYKVRLAENSTFEGLFLGTSRMERLGNTELATKLTGLDFFNHSFGAQTLYESLEYFKHVIKEHDIKYLILSLDIFQFNKTSELYNQDLPKNIISKYDDLKYYIYYYTFYDSLKTVYKNLVTKPTIYNTKGWRIMNEFDYYSIPKDKRESYLYDRMKIDESTFQKSTKFTLDYEKLEYLFSLLEMCKKQNIKVDLYFNPTHISMYHDIHFNNFNEIKKLKKLIVDKTDFYDFSGISSVSEDYRNFWDSSHSQNFVSKYILDYIISGNKYRDFGSFITKQNINEFIEQYKKDRDYFYGKYSHFNSVLQ